MALQNKHNTGDNTRNKTSDNFWHAWFSKTQFINEKTPIHIFLNSGGGEVWVTFLTKTRDYDETRQILKYKDNFYCGLVNPCNHIRALNVNAL